VAKSLGVPRIQVVVPATHDTASAVAGLPVAMSTAAGSWAFVSLGTWAICGFESEEPRATLDVLEAGFGNEGGVDGTTLVVRNLVGLWILQECRTVWTREQDAALEWSAVRNASDAAEPFVTFIDIDDPRFGAVAADMTQLITAYCTETGQGAPVGMGPVARCVYESLVMKIRERVHDIEELSGTQLSTLHVVGGGVQNTQLCQWIADATGLSVVAGPVETTSVGNALMQLKAAGIVTTISQAREISNRSFDLASYQPRATRAWDVAYERYVAVIS
jgi:sugar (pentulose or hexulose) kinase